VRATLRSISLVLQSNSPSCEQILLQQTENIMLSSATRRIAASTARRSFVTSVKEAATADDALRFSGYSAIDFTVPEDAPVYDAVQKFAAFNIGCLVTVDTAGTCVVFCGLVDWI
jgi:hypothetical protein